MASWASKCIPPGVEGLYAPLRKKMSLPVVNATESTERARDDVLAHVVKTYFADSPEQAVTALLRMSDVDLDDAEVDRLRKTIRRARQSGR